MPRPLGLGSRVPVAGPQLVRVDVLVAWKHIHVSTAPADASLVWHKRNVLIISVFANPSIPRGGI